MAVHKGILVFAVKGWAGRSDDLKGREEKEEIFSEVQKEGRRGRPGKGKRRDTGRTDGFL